MARYTIYTPSEPTVPPPIRFGPEESRDAALCREEIQVYADRILAAERELRWLREKHASKVGELAKLERAAKRAALLNADQSKGDLP